MTSLIETLVSSVAKILEKKHLKIVTAESCTGGGLSFWMTSIPGSSQWFERGFVTYSDAAKIEMLGVNPTTIQNFGAVSEETAREMAEGALRMSLADISIAITGIAGPSGGTAQKPVGTVWFAWMKRNAPPFIEVQHFEGSRQNIRMRCIEKALEKLLDMIANPHNNTG